MNRADRADEATIYGAGEGVVYHARGSAIIFKARGVETANAFSLMRRELPPGGRAPMPHRHPGTQEAFCVLSGTIEFLIAERSVSVGAGSFVLIPAAVRHTFSNRVAETAQVLILHAPALDEYFADLDRLSGRPSWDPDAELEMMRRHGIDPAP